jgi:hypothetical protein
MERLDEETRFINGIKIDVSKGNEDYFKILKDQQKKNIRLGFGDNSKNWEKKLYEEQRRQARIDKHTHTVVKFGTKKKRVNKWESAKADTPTIDKKQARVKVSLEELTNNNWW